jgi:surface polysaccharide O-acyltransferase-like enzyme
MGAHQPLVLSLAFLNCLSRFAVPLFIILSGFYLSLNRNNERAKPFYRRTLRFLLVPYIAYTGLYSLLDFRKTGDVVRVLRNFFTAEGAPHLWFGLLILQLYLLHPALSRWYRTRRHHGLIVILAFFIQIAVAIMLSMRYHHADLLTLGAPFVGRLGAILFVSHIGYFFGGYYLSEHSDEAVRLFRNPIFVGAGVAIWLFGALGLEAFWSIPMFQGQEFSSTIRTYLAHDVLIPLLSFAALVSVFSFLQKYHLGKTISSRLLSTFGLYSYGIYYLQALSLWAVGWILRGGAGLDVGDILYYLLLFPIGSLLSLFAARTLSKLPFGRYLT